MSERGDKGYTVGECNLIQSKDAVFVETVGAIDSFQARLGWTRVVLEEKEEKQKIFQIEKDLSEIMGSLYTGEKWQNGKNRIEKIEEDSGKYSGRIKNLDGFLIPGENEVESRVNICRTDCRGAERKLVALKADEDVLKYFNKLSGFLFLMWSSKF